MSDAFSVRPVSRDDQAFLFEALHIALWTPDPPFRQPIDWLKLPHVARCVEDWGRMGDLGIIATHGETPIGAAWLRLPQALEQELAFIDEQTPILGIGVLEPFQQRGVGSRLLTALIEAAQSRYDAVALSHHPQNPAARLYAKFGFVEVDERRTFKILRLDLKQHISFGSEN
ncbi:MAG TPA: GNAT family N-acetyltransferase [Abditibacterium sp.]|jgi:GNAT superfamily N-acetyltransferase